MLRNQLIIVGIQYCSDLHLEFKENKEYLRNNPIQPVGDILILSGDIVPFSLLVKFNDFFNYLADNFETVYWIPGNHEYYHYDITNRAGSFSERIRENVLLVNNVSVLHKNTNLIFSTLWSLISEGNQGILENNINDFRLIKNNDRWLSAEIFNQLHADSLSFLESELSILGTQNKIVVSHHVPTLLNYPEKYKTSPLTEAFAVELYDFIDKYQPDFWIYGHHHCNMPEFNIGKTRLVTNQLGYVQNNEHHGFIPDACLLMNEEVSSKSQTH